MKTTTRQFSIRIIDAHCKEREFGPIDLEVKDNELVGWDAVAAEEKEASDMVRSDLTAVIYVPPTL